MEIIGIKPVERACDFNSKGRGIQCLSIGQHDLDAMTQLVLKTTALWNEIYRDESDPLNFASI
jgi:hypothetical protein